MTLAKHELAALLGIAAIAANVLLWDFTQASHRQETQQQWQQAVEARLTRLETKMDRLLNTTDLALSLARTKLPKTR